MSKLTRHQVREKAVQALFQLVPVRTVDSVDEAVHFALEAGNDPEEGYVDVDDAYLDRLVSGVMKNETVLDEQISQYLLDDWTIDRIARIDRTILRLAFYEMLYEQEMVPSSVAVSEAVLLCKEFSDDKSRQFVNGVLNRLLHDIEK